MTLNAALATLIVPEDNWQPVAMARGLMRGYDARWRAAQENIEVHSIEHELSSELINPTTQRKSRTFTLAGVIDKIGDEDGIVVYDHKTTSQDISGADSMYWRLLQINSQAKHYELLMIANGIKVDRIVWDVIRKPGIRPKKLAKIAQAEIVSLGTYCGFQVSQATIDSVQSNPEENAELYEHRVARDSIDNSDRYFQRQSVNRTDAELVEYWEEVWDISKEILTARKNSRWYRNSGACFNYGTPCEYLGICSGHDTPDSDRWDHTDRETNALSESRLKTFQTCRRKYFYRYELGITSTKEDSEALYFGSLFHTALNAWWADSTKETSNDSNERPTIEAGGSDVNEVSTRLAF